MSLCQIDNVDIVAHSCAVVSRVIVTEYAELLKSACGYLCDVRHKVVGNSVWILSDCSALVSADRIEVAEKHNRKVGICVCGVAENLLHHQLCPAVGVGRTAGGHCLYERNGLGSSVNRSRRAENEVIDLVLTHGFEQGKG